VKPVEIMLSPKRRKEMYKYLEKLFYDLSSMGAPNFITSLSPEV
jgi:hypothetical protein